MNSTTTAKLSITTAISYQLLLLILIALRPDLPVYSTTISEWAIGRFGWLMQIAFILSASSYLFLFLTLRSDINRKAGKIGLVMLIVAAIGTTAVGIFVSDPYPPDFTLPTTVIHTIGGTLGMISIPVSALLIGFNLAKQWSNYSMLLKVFAFFPLIAFAGFNIHLNLYVIPLGENAVGEHVPIGYPPRIMFLVYHLWVISTAVLFIRNHSQTNRS